MGGHIAHLTGHQPPTCPWRAFYSPLVGEVIKVAGLAAENLAPFALDLDPPAIIADGLSVYLAAKRATRAHDDEIRRKEHEKSVRAAAARRNQR